MSAGDKVVCIDSVTRSFVGGNGEAIDALGPISLDLEEGEFVCIVGPSGCGKSTLLRIVAGLIRPSDGRISIRRTDDTRKTEAAMVFQEYSIFPWKTVRQNVRYGLDLSGVDRSEANRIADEWIDRLALTGFGDAYPSTLSGGMKQRVSIARALAVDPDILLMDEPFAALDAQLRTVLQDELLQLWDSHPRSALFVTHSLDEAILLGDRVIVMSSRPGTTLASVAIDFERPRSPQLRADERFRLIEQQLWELLRAEIDTGIAAEGHGG